MTNREVEIAKKIYINLATEKLKELDVEKKLNLDENERLSDKSYSIIDENLDPLAQASFDAAAIFYRIKKDIQAEDDTILHERWNENLPEGWRGEENE